MKRYGAFALACVAVPVSLAGVACGSDAGQKDPAATGAAGPDDSPPVSSPEAGADAGGSAGAGGRGEAHPPGGGDGGRGTSDGGQGTSDGGRGTSDGGQGTSDGGQGTSDGGQGTSDGGRGSGGRGNPSAGGTSDGGAPSASGAGGEGGRVTVDNPLTDPTDGPPAGNPDGQSSLPDDAGLEDTSNPDQVIGDGTPQSCTGQAFIDAVAEGGVITFDCGSDPLTIVVPTEARIFNDHGDVVIDGGGLITLSGGGDSRILYMNTCDESLVWTSTTCQNQDSPHLTVQNLTFVDGDSRGATEYQGGGALWVRGGRFKVVNCRFFNNISAELGPDVGGGALRVLSQYQGLPVYVVNSTFGGAPGYGNTSSNGGAISSIGVSWTFINSLLSYNRAVGNGGNPAVGGTPGGGSGGAIYNDGNTMTLTLRGTLVEFNEVNAFGAGVFFVSNDHSGDIVLEQSIVRDNLDNDASDGAWHVLPGIAMHDDTARSIDDASILENP